MTIHPVRRGALLPLTAFLLTVLSMMLSAQEWRALGPWGGGVWGIVRDSVTGATLAGAGFGIWRLSDADDRWEPWFDLQSIAPRYSVLGVVPTDDGLFLFGRSGLHVSSDGGSSWTLQYEYTDPGAGFPHFIKVGDTLYLHPYTRTLLASTDNGATWSRVDTIPFAPHSFATDGTRLYATGNDGLYERIAGGGWSRLTGLPTATPGYPSQLFMQGDTLIYWIARQVIARSFDRGGHWLGIVDTGSATPILHDGALWKVEGAGFYTLPHDQEEWTLLAPVSVYPAMRFFYLLARESDIVMGDLFETLRWEQNTERVTWYGKGMNSAGAISLGVEGDTLLAQGPYTLHYSADDGATWESRRKPSQLGLQNYVVADRIAYGISTHHDSLFTSTDWGASWSAREIDPDTIARPSALHVVGESIVVGSNALHRSTDAGETWTKRTLPAGHYVQQIIGSRDTIVANVSSPSPYWLRSLDRGTTWDSIATIGAAPLSSESIYTEGLFYVSVLGGGLVRSSDQGVSWQSIGEELPRSLNGADSVILAYGIHAAGDTVLVATLAVPTFTTRLFLSVDRGEEWREVRQPHVSSAVSDMRRDADQLLIGTDRGIFATDFPLELSGVDLSHRIDEPDLRLAFDTHENRLRWAGERLLPYRLDLYTLTGEHVALIAEGEAAAGTHALPLDDLPAGAYLCVLHSGGESAAVVVTAR